MAGLRSWLGLADDDDPVQKALGLLGQGGSAPEASYNDPTAGGTLSQPLPSGPEPPYQPSFAPEDYSTQAIEQGYGAAPAAPSAPWSLSDAVAPVRSAVSSAVGPAAAAYGGAFERVNREEDEAAARVRGATTSPALQAAIAPLEAIRRATRLGTAAIEATPEAIRETANAAATPLGLGREDVGVDLPWVGRTGITDAALALAPSDRAQAIMNAAGGVGRAPVGPAAGAVAGALEAGGDWAASRVRGAVQGAGRRLSDAISANAERVGAADARMAETGGSATANAAFGITPNGPQRGDGAQTVEVLQQRLQQAQGVVDRLMGSGDAARLAQAQDARAAVESQLVDAQNARRELEPRIRSDVGARESTLPPSAETVENRVDAIQPPRGGRMAPEDLSGPVSIPTDPGSRLNAGFGVVPEEAPRTRGRANRATPAQDADALPTLPPEATEPINNAVDAIRTRRSPGAQQALEAAQQSAENKLREQARIRAEMPGLPANQVNAAIKRQGFTLTKEEEAARLGFTGQDEVLSALREGGVVPSEAVAGMLGQYPAYLNGVVDFIMEQRQKLLEGALSSRDVAKAYLHTVGSMQSGAMNRDVLEGKIGRSVRDINVDRGQVRPEAAVADWLFTPQGKRALDGLADGTINRADWEDLLRNRDAYGSNTLRNSGVFGPFDKASREVGWDQPVPRYRDGSPKTYDMRNIQELTNAINATLGDPAQLQEIVSRIKGIGPAKPGFIKHMLGLGSDPTFDAVEMNTWLAGRGDTGGLRGGSADLARAMKLYSDSPQATRELFGQIQSRFDELRRAGVGGDLSPEVFNHIMHHWIWDRAKGLETTHAGMYDAMRNAATLGTLPEAAAPTDRLGAVNRVLGQGLASSVSGGVGAQVNQQANPDDPYAAAKGFAAGALLPLAASKGAGAIARRVGATVGREGGALATLGALPGEAPRPSAGISKLGRRVMDAYNVVTPARVEASTARSIQIAGDAIAGKVPGRGPRLTVTPSELMADVHAAIVKNLADTKTVMTGLRPGALAAYVRGEGLTSKLETRDIAKIDKITQAQVNVSGGRKGVVDGRKAKIPYTLEDAANFADRQGHEQRAAVAGTRMPDRATGEIDDDAPRVMYAYVSEGQPLVGPNRPTLWLDWEHTTPRATSNGHPYGLTSPGQVIHESQPAGQKAANNAPDAIRGGRRVPGPGGEPLVVDWERRGVKVAPGRRMADTDWLVGADGENAMRANTLIQSIPKEVQQAIARGEMTDPEQIAAVMMRGGAPQWKPGWAAAVSAQRSESLIVDPSLENVRAIYLTATPANLASTVENTGGLTELQVAQKMRADIKAQYDKDVPILWTDISQAAPSAKKRAGADFARVATPMNEAQVLEGERIPMAPGRERVVGQYTQATDPATGRPYTNLGGGIPFDPSGAALGAGAGAASEDDQGQQADPWRTAGGLVMGGVAGKRFPGVEKALARAQAGAASRAARMAANPELRRPSAADWFKSLGFSGIYGPATAVSSAIGGAQELLLAQPKEALRALVEGRPVATGAQARRQVSAVGEGLANLGRVIMGSSPDAAAAASGGSQGTAGLSARVVNPAGHAAARFLEKPGEILTEAPDALFRPQFREQGMAREAYRVAKENGFKGDKAKAYVDTLMGDVEQLRAHPTTRSTSDNARRVLAAGEQYADQLGYKGKPGKLGQKLADLSKDDGPAGVLASFLMPFPGMASKMMEGAARITPGVGLLPSVRRGQASRFDVAYDQGLGTLAAAGIAAWAMQGGITGSGPDDPEKRQQMLAQGWQPNSVLVGDHFLPSRAFGKFQPLLDAAGEIHDGLAYGKKDRKYSDIVGDMIKRAAKIAVDQTGLSGLADLYDLSQNADAMGPGFVARSAVRYLPWGGTLRAAAAAMDPVQRRASKWGDEAVPTTAIGEGIETAIPGLRQNVAPAQDVLGRPMENPQRGLGAILPRTTTLREDPLIKEFQAAGVDIAAAPPDVDGVPLSAAQQRRYTEVMGRELQRLAAPSMASGTWRSMDPATRKLLLETFQGTARTLAGVAVASEGGQDFNAARTKAIIEKATGR